MSNNHIFYLAAANKIKGHRTLQEEAAAAGAAQAAS
jgi:hypothetical protein